MFSSQRIWSGDHLVSIYIDKDVALKYDLWD